MSVLYKEFTNDEEVVTAIQSMKAKGIEDKHIYVITHDDDRTDRVADNADANTVTASDVGLGTAAKNLFRKKETSSERSSNSSVSHRPKRINLRRN
ncbi:general stress protein [Exiguobacterium mexicanum]|uniref:general stress protein n=1 Tax=Exiguobacterium mexicanum TaxID=340146 RepID=UPI0037BEFDCD